MKVRRQFNSIRMRNLIVGGGFIVHFVVVGRKRKKEKWTRNVKPDACVVFHCFDIVLRECVCVSEILSVFFGRERDSIHFSTLFFEKINQTLSMLCT